ncbi:palmitoyltransferase ZDHHC22-like [Tubulanus polymorphus]|uniref:palmitoyltransferase ZDHHC22-like n=1 Tax=Tubulanus polymorphus TaxID=672921 RepID=UPI003DA5DAFB
MTSSSVYVVLFDVIPTLASTNPTMAARHFMISFFFLFEMLGNLVLVISADNAVRSIEITASTRKLKGKRKCEICIQPMPRRSHHCRLCGACILKRDHHCHFLVTCIGYKNQKYFVMFCLYLGFGAIYSAVLILLHLRVKYSVIFRDISSFLTVLPRAIYDYYIAHSIANEKLYLLILMYAALLTGLLIIGLFVWQMILVSRGQTSFEFAYDRHNFRKRMMWNFLDVFGPYWFVTIILPFPLPQYSLGTYEILTTKHRVKKLRNNDSSEKSKNK